MACFLIPATEAIITTVITKVIQSKEKEHTVKIDSDNGSFSTTTKIPFSRKLKWLNNLLWGGSALLAFEHVWHGEVTLWFPFLTAASNPAAVSKMLVEMSTVGVAMAVLVTAVWAVMLVVSGMIEKKELKLQPAAE